MSKPQYHLGEGWDGDLTVGEGMGGEKYADLSIYHGDECILDLGINHYQIHCDGDLAEMRPRLMEMIRRLNEREWDNAIPNETLARDLRAEAEARIQQDLGVPVEIAHRLVNNGLCSLSAFEGTESRDFIDMGFSESDTLKIMDGLRRANS